MTAAPDSVDAPPPALVFGSGTSEPARHLHAVPAVTQLPPTPPMPRHLRSLSRGGVHHHEWILREALNSETSASTSWFECGACGQSYE